MENSILDQWEDIVRHPKIGEILLQHKKLTITQLDNLLFSQKEDKMPLGELLIKNNIISKDELVRLLLLQIDIDSMLAESLKEIKYSANYEQ